MIFEPTPLPGLHIVRPQMHADARGAFARLWCAADFAAAGLAFVPAQISISVNHQAGTLRGLHWQAAPFAETKLVQVTRGRIWDVAVDLRPDSETRRAWFGLELDAEAHTSLLIPAGFAHGFITLSDAAEVLYCINTPYAAEAARGARYDDPALAIAWPCSPTLLSARDAAWPALTL